MKIELKHLAPYLPYRIKMEWIREDDEIIHNDLTVSDYNFLIGKHAKPILRPLSDLTKEIEANGEKFIPLKNLEKIIDEYGNADPTILIIKSFSGIYFEWYAGSQIAVRRSVPLSFYEKLYEWHFDVHGLIKEGLAIDINTL
jgi:hypothetical protein